uniref:Lebercilin domain-containing protein n=1 Tax=Neobodo designis TaxID=312471 RepID=A0A7S1Q4L1_NEODS|mmetsp:Transcript_32923/g.101735  ORF Transcript_32923/g.101735 Transcript_32923/m.101735 type:complete len:322 (+) Transcript_32923:31-996(+)|eukprot:CAMPEP_0174850748 /NCGR_PEP_ID=MMETSP1114-20130205/21121_1 /TAXON_ID=312471 /ORGANISM="Neobodo designis, Strain CCAP 1951/1" /LENGTH=321 /DNA_ID=CAMNT_0016085235 /DNA_START=30 /DNA_END=995 /DNA_ORIENTATION=+
MSDYDDDFESEASPTRSEVAASAHPSARKRASSQGSQRPRVTHERRLVTPPSALVQLSSDDSREIAELRKANLALRAELLSLNTKLDEQLGQRGQRVSRAPAVARGAAMLPSDRLSAKNDQLRRENAELREQLNRPHIQQRMSEIRNAIGHVLKQLEDANSELKGLQNVQAHQDQQLVRIRAVEAEMAATRGDHAEVLRRAKEQSRQLKDVREADMAEYSKLIRHVERMEEKVKVQNEIGAAVKSVETVKEQVDEKDRMIDALKYQVAVLSRTSAGDKKKTKAVRDRLQRELHNLREEASSLRKQVKALGTAAEMGVDTRV